MQGWRGGSDLTEPCPCHAARPGPSRIRRGRWAPQPAGGTCSGWPTAGCHRRSAAGQSRTRTLVLARTSGDGWARPPHPHLATWGRGMAGGFDLLSKEDKAPKSHVFFPTNPAAHLWAERPDWRAGLRSTHSRASAAPTPPPGKSGLHGRLWWPGCWGSAASDLRVQAPGAPSRLERGWLRAPLVHLCALVRRGVSAMLEHIDLGAWHTQGWVS